MDMTKKQVITLALLMLALPSLGEGYRFLGQKTNWEGAYVAALINSGLIVVGGLWQVLSIDTNNREKFFQFQKKNLSAQLGPGVVLLGLVIAACMVSKFLFPISSTRPSINLQILLLTCFIVPVLEELLFRGVLSSLLRQSFRPLSAAYISVLSFSLLHSLTGFKDLYELNFGLVLGPFILGLICELLRFRFKSLLSPIVFHGACNFSVYAFSFLDPRWLKWLSWLYL